MDTSSLGILLALIPTCWTTDALPPVAPAEQALGMGGINGGCLDCHTTEFIDWPALGWTDDPLRGGERNPATQTEMFD